MHIEPNASKGQVCTYLFGQLNVAAAQTAVAIPAAGNVGGGTDFNMLWETDVIGLTYTLSVAGTTGAFTVSATINGTVVAASTVTVGTTTKGYIRIPRGKSRLIPTDRLGVKITTAAGWDGITGDLIAVVYALHSLDGI